MKTTVKTHKNQRERDSRVGPGQFRGHTTLQTTVKEEMMRIPRTLVVCALVVVALTACGGAGTPDPQSIAQYAAATVAAIQTSAASQAPVVPEKVTQVIEVTRIVPQTVVVRETVIVTTTPEPLPTATPEPERKTGYELGPVSSYRDSINSLWFMAQITNTGTTPLGAPELVITLRDDDGQVLGVVTGDADLPVLAPGASIPVTALAFDEPKGWTKFEAQANVEEASDYFLNIYAGQVETMQAAMTQDGKEYRVAGEVKNVGAQTLESVIVVVGLYDAAGQLVGAADGAAEIKPVQPGASSPFSVDGIQVTARPATQRVWLAGRIQ